ncbi:unnamed protein product, partial [Heterosigma akashiwo]
CGPILFLLFWCTSPSTRCRPASGARSGSPWTPPLPGGIFIHMQTGRTKLEFLFPDPQEYYSRQVEKYYGLCQFF